MKNLILAIFLSVSAVTSIVTGYGQVTNSLEYWIGTNNSKIFINANGVAGGVMDGSTRSNFDYNMDHIPQHANIHLGAGTFYSLGSYAGWTAKTGQRIIGSGIDVTILRHPPNLNSITNVYQNTFTMVAAGNQSYNNIDVENLTIDSNYTPGQTNTLQAVQLWGSNNTIRNVRWVNGASLTFNPSTYIEAFGMLISAPVANQTPNLSRGNLIEGCSIHGYTCDGANQKNDLVGMGFANGANGIISHNQIVQTGLTNIILPFSVPLFDSVIDGNVTVNCGLVFHSDVGVIGHTNITIVNNRAFGACRFMDLENGIHLNVTIADNTIALTNLYGFIGPIDFMFAPLTQTNIGWIVTGNHVVISNPSNLAPENCYMNAGNSIGMEAMNNVVDGLLTNYFQTGNTNVLIHNFDQFGNHSAGNVGTY